MKKRVLSLFLALCLFGGNCLTAFAETAYQEGAADDLALEPQWQPQNGNEIPVLTQDSIAIDLEHQYPGMDKTYGAGYSGTVAERKLRLVLPLLNQGGLSIPIDVTLSAAFLTAEEKQESIISQSMDLGNGQAVENVYLADFEISLPDSAVPGSYPVTITVKAGEPAQTLELQLPNSVSIPEPATPPTEPSSSTEPSAPKLPTVLEIDSSHIYSGMTATFPELATGL